MFKRIKLNVKNVILGCHNFSDILATHDTRILSGFSGLVVPRAVVPRAVVPLCRLDYDYYMQASSRRITLNNAEALLPRKLENLSLKWVSSEKPVTRKWLDEVLTRLICTAAYGLPWESSYSFYYDKKCPQCSPSAPTAPIDCPKCPVLPCPPPKAVPTFYQKLCYPFKQLKNTDPCAKITLCTRKTIFLNNYRFYSASPCKPKDLCKKKAKPCKPKPCAPKKEKCKPKCDEPPPCEPKECKPKCGGDGGGPKESCGKPKTCDPKTKACGSDEFKKGPVCP